MHNPLGLGHCICRSQTIGLPDVAERTWRSGRGRAGLQLRRAADCRGCNSDTGLQLRREAAAQPKSARRLSMPSFCSTFETCVFTVGTPTNSSLAISEFV
ncbi:hypothetical protein GCM10009692_27970 [Leucobacter aridicollis]